MGLQVKACWNCKEYIPLHDASRGSQLLEAEFKETHSGHTLMTMNVDEAKEGGYNQSKMGSE